MLHLLVGILDLLSALGFLLGAAHEFGRRRGFREGRAKGSQEAYSRGWQSCADWFIEAELGVERERERIWREEG